MSVIDLRRPADADAFDAVIEVGLSEGVDSPRYLDALVLYHSAEVTRAAQRRQNFVVAPAALAPVREAPVEAQPTAETNASPTYIAVKQLATAIGQSDGATRKLLARELIPGARRRQPGVKNSPWLIPASSPAAYLDSFSRTGKERK